MLLSHEVGNIHFLVPDSDKPLAPPPSLPKGQFSCFRVSIIGRVACPAQWPASIHWRLQRADLAKKAGWL